MDAYGSIWRHLGGIWKHLQASGRYLGSIWEASSGIWGIWEASGRHLVALAGWLGWLTEIPVLTSKTNLYIGFSWPPQKKLENVLFLGRFGGKP